MVAWSMKRCLGGYWNIKSNYLFIMRAFSLYTGSKCMRLFEFLDMFLTAKHLEGCSDKTIRYYRCNIEKMLDTVNIPVIKITTEMLRKYLVEYQTINNCGKVTIDNIRRSLSTFFSWLEEEDYIIKSPMKRIHKVKTAVIVKDTIPDEKIEILRDNCNNLRDRAMIDFLLSTGIRVGELVRLNIDDIVSLSGNAWFMAKETKRGKHILMLRPKFIC